MTIGECFQVKTALDRFMEATKSVFCSSETFSSILSPPSVGCVVTRTGCFLCRWLLAIRLAPKKSCVSNEAPPRVTEIADRGGVGAGDCPSRRPQGAGDCPNRRTQGAGDCPSRRTQGARDNSNFRPDGAGDSPSFSSSSSSSS